MRKIVQQVRDENRAFRHTPAILAAIVSTPNTLNRSASSQMKPGATNAVGPAQLKPSPVATERATAPTSRKSRVLITTHQVLPGFLSATAKTARRIRRAVDTIAVGESRNLRYLHEPPLSIGRLPVPPSENQNTTTCIPPLSPFC